MEIDAAGGMHKLVGLGVFRHAIAPLQKGRGLAPAVRSRL
jgi:hypothetical protein